MTPCAALVCGRLMHMAKTARMWGSPEELEAAAQHLFHVACASARPGWAFDDTRALWLGAGGPFAGDAEVHAEMRAKLWQDDEALARGQVVTGYAVVWAQLERQAAREAEAGPWVERLLEEPGLAGTPDRLNMTLFALMGFVAADAARYVGALEVERARVGGHGLRPLCAVGPPGPAVASAAWARRFSSWHRVAEGVEGLAGRLGGGHLGPVAAI